MILLQWDLAEPEAVGEKVLLSVTLGEPNTKSPPLRLGFFMMGRHGEGERGRGGERGWGSVEFGLRSCCCWFCLLRPHGRKIGRSFEE